MKLSPSTTRTTALLARTVAVTALLGAGVVAAPLPASAASDVVLGVRADDVLVAAGVDRDRLDRDLAERRASRSTARTRLAPRAAGPVAVQAPQGVVVERLPIPFPTVRREDPSRYRGTEAVAVAGREGALERTYGDLGSAGRVLLREERVREPQTRVVAVGTKPRPVAARTYGGLDWAALAQCESGGNPRAVSSSGKFRGLYQFSLSTWRSVGGSGDPIEHDRDAQTSRAYALYQRDGRAPWPECGSRL
ncbi:MAG: hypothetical protein JWM64_413 [Frankiales bacterium]|nr:hypothetical protein [Frankiales bacterium]